MAKHFGNLNTQTVQPLISNIPVSFTCYVDVITG